MKKIVLFLSLALVSFVGANAQFTVAHDTSSVTGANAIDVHNPLTSGTNGLTISWKVLDYNLATGWTVAGICDNALCYSGNILLGGAVDADPINSGENIDFKVQFEENGAAASSVSWVKVKFTDKANSLNTEEAVFVATKNPVGVVSVTRSTDNIIVYPNPAKDFVNVVFDQNMGVKNIAIYNLIGKVVSVYKVNGNSAKLDLTNSASGIYFIRMMNSNGAIVATRKFTHQ